MKKENMKIRTDGMFEVCKVLERLRSYGYETCGDQSVYMNAVGLFAYDSGIIMKTDDMGYFISHPNELHVLSNDKFVAAKNYYKQPETANAQPPHDGTPALIAKQKAVADKILDKLFPIDPFAIVAGGAPRDWHFGNAATDVDVFFHTGVEQLTIVSDMLRHVGIDIDAARSGDGIPEWYKLNPNISCVFDSVVDGVNVQIILMTYKTQDTVVPQFPFTICKAWYKHGGIHLDAEFKKCDRHKIVVQTNNLYSDEHKYVQKMKNKFPDWKFFDSWEAAYKYVFENGSV